MQGKLLLCIHMNRFILKKSFLVPLILYFKGLQSCNFWLDAQNSRKKIQTHFEFPYMEINGHFLGVFEGFSLV